VVVESADGADLADVVFVDLVTVDGADAAGETAGEEIAAGAEAGEEIVVGETVGEAGEDAVNSKLSNSQTL
jgi:hypothetical protein